MNHKEALTIDRNVEPLAKSQVLGSEQLPFTCGSEDSSCCHDVDHHHRVALAKKEFPAIS